MRALNNEEINNALKQLSDWELDSNCIKRTFAFKDFNANFAFMTKVALLAEKHNHHPDWSGGYNRLTIALSTHDVNGISEKDFALAAEIDKVYP